MSAFVVKGSFVVFVSRITAQSRDDALNSLLLAQLVADKKFNRFQGGKEWYKIYHDTLDGIGWITQVTQYSDHISIQRTFTAEDILEAVGTKPNAEVLTAFQALRSLPVTNRWRAMLRDSAQQEPDATNPLGYINVDVWTVSSKEKELTASSVNFAFQYQDQQGLFFENLPGPPYAVQGPIQAVSSTMTISEAKLQGLRQELVAKLGSKIDQYIGGVDAS